MEQLDQQLAELAQQLGVSAGELWSWLQRTGIDELAKASIARLSAEVIIAAIALCVCVVVSVLALRHDDVDDIDAMAALVTICVFVGIIALVILVMAVPPLIAWVVSPQGQVIRMLLG